MAERLSASGYAAIGKQTNATTPVIPTIYIPYYKQNLATNWNVIEDNPVYGNKFKSFQTLPGQRSHKGTITVMAEPNTAAFWLDMLLTKSSSTVLYTFTVTAANATVGATFTNNSQTFTVTATIAAGTTLICTGTGAPTASGTLTKATGTGDATITFSAFAAGGNVHTFGLSGVTDPYPYTLDVSFVSQTVRYIGFQANKITPSWAGDEMQFQISGSALASFAGREVASIAGQVITLTTSYDPNPTYGLVVGDLISVKSPDGTTRNLPLVVSSITATTVTVTGTVTGIVGGDMLVLRAASAPSLNVQQPFIMPLTQFQFGATVATAAVAAQTRIESSFSLDLIHDFESDDGAARTGGFDPASLVRTRGDFNFKIKEYFDAPDKLKDWLAINKKACVLTCTSPSNSAYKLIMNMYDLRIKTENIPTGSDDVIYQEEDFTSNYSQTDGLGMQLQVINNVSVV